jgi:outer membrane immunogenic protein
LERTYVIGSTRSQREGRTVAFMRQHRGGTFLVAALVWFAVAAAAKPAHAADLAVVIEPPSPAEFHWTGFYIGVNAGGGIDHFAFPYSIGVPNGSVQGTNGITASGPVGGIQAGFNYELPFFHIVAGIEIDTDASGITGQTTVTSALATGLPVNATFGTKFKDFGTARLRLGYAWGRLMPYLAGGFTYGTTESYFSAITPGLFAMGANTETRSGVIPHVATIGIGVEYAIAQNFTLKAEYLYDFINARLVTFNPVPGSTVSFDNRTAYHIARLGFNYKFNWLSPVAGPVAAKY